MKPAAAPPEALLRELFEGAEPMENPQAIGTPGAQAEHARNALQATLRALKQREQLLRRVAVVLRGIGDQAQAEVGLRQAARVRAQAARLAELIAEGTGGA